MWGNVSADIFNNHPVKQFDLETVPVSMTGYLPAATEWYMVLLPSASLTSQEDRLTSFRLDGLNEYLSAWNKNYYGRWFLVDVGDISI
jgi:hypothetical protein